MNKNMQQAQAGENRRSVSKKVESFFMTYGFYVLLVLLILFFSVSSKTFFSLDNLLQILSASSFLFAVAAGTTLVIITGNMDLSVGSIALVSAAVMVILSNTGIATGLAVLIGIGVGAVIGLINGVLTACLKLNSMLVTLGLQIAYRGLGMQITGGQQIKVSEALKAFGMAKVGGVAVIFLICLAIMILLQIVLKKTRFGAYCYALGCNELAIKKMGIPVKSVKIAVFVIAGICSAITGLIVVSKLGVLQNTVGKGIEFDVIAAVVIGGTSLLGGRGSILPGTLFGVFLLYVIDNGLAVLGASPFIYPFAQGIIIFIAMYLDALNGFKRKSA
jgi:ribose transport system permease protein